MKTKLHHIVHSGLVTSILLLLFLGSSQTVFSQTTVTLTTVDNGNTVTIPANATNVIVEVWGAGGSGAGGSKSGKNNVAGGGGGGGEYSRSINISPGTYSFQVGAGAPGGPSAGNGSQGVSSSFNGGAVLANGGGGGIYNGAGGAGGTGGAGNDANVAGTNGSAVAGTVGGDGGAGANGGAGGTGSSQGIGTDGSIPGGGGGGSSGNGQTGGAGADGQIVITYTLGAVCSLTSSGLSNILCNDNGTPANPGDDTFTFDLDPTGTNLGATYNITGDITDSGTYGSPTNFGPYPISGGNLSITITDISGSCSIGETVTAPASCSGSCNLTSSGLTAIVCSDNGTPTIPGDDTFTFDLNPTGSNLGTSYTVSGGASGSGTYGSATTFGPYPISGGNLSITITDDTDGSCTIGETVTAPAPCSSPVCNLSASGLANIICNNNGTSANPSDDTFSFDLNPTGTDLGATYSVSGDITQSGISYGSPTNFSGYLISAGSLSITITDVSTDCSFGPFTVTPPAPCSFACNITSSGLTILCDGKGTYDGSDDEFSFTLNPTGVGLGSTYTISGDESSVESYGSVSTIFGPYPASGGSRTITITDDTDGTCQIIDILVSPGSCSHDFTECSSCHIFHSAPGNNLTNRAGNALLCQSCHAPGFFAANKPLLDGDKAIPGSSGNSHAWNVDGLNSTYQTNLPTNNAMLVRMPDDTGQKQIICSTCHNQHNNNAGPPYLRIDNTGDAMCKDCHSVRNVQRFADGAANKGSHPVGVTYDGGLSKLNSTPTSTQVVGGSVECSSCHGLHDVQNSGTLTTDGNLLRMPNDVNLCKDCHNYVGHSGYECLDCHEVHNTVDGTIGGNIMMIRDNIDTPGGNRPVVFLNKSGPDSFVDTSTPRKGICVVCHSGLSHDNYNDDALVLHDDATNKAGTTCTSCHLHSDATNGFTQPSGPQTCTSCHASAQSGGRGSVVQIVGSGGEFDISTRTSTHVGGATPIEPDATSCEACHYESAGDHPTSQMLLEDPENLNTVFSGDTDVYCVGCHDGAPPAGLWTDITAAKYDKSAFIGGPHDFATNSCAQCHERHGSDFANLLKDSDNYRVCRNCHDGGVSSINIDVADIAFPGVTGNSHRWDVNATNPTLQVLPPLTSPMVDRMEGSNVVCSTCHQPHAGTAKLLAGPNNSDQLCKDCHRPRDKGRFKDDIVNNKGSHPVGLAYTAGGNYVDPAPTLSNTNVGLVNGNIECSSCHAVHNATTTDGYLLRETMDNATCKECHNYQPHQGFDCLDCHTVHNTTNIMLVKETVNGSSVVFASEGTTASPVQASLNSFSDGNATRDGICEVCHTTTLYHTGNADDGVVHNDGTSCVSCHPHRDSNTGISFPQGSCHDCHEEPGTPNQLYPMTGAHEAHAGSLYAYGCSTCHFGHGQGGANEPSHSSGTIDVVFNPNGLASRFGNDAATPTWDPGTKTCSNIYCHSNGRSSFRGDINGSGAEAALNTWSGDAGVQMTPIYVNPTPRWDTGTIPKAIGNNIGCDYCHPSEGGKSGPVIGNFIPPYTFTASTAPAAKSMFNPDTGAHTSTGAHETNSGHYTDNDVQPWNGTGYDDGWPEVMCFWCHNADPNNVNPTDPKLQGTYGTQYHVDGYTWFNPYNYDPNNPTTNPIGHDGPGQGTMAPGLDRGSGTHCSSGQSCW